MSKVLALATIALVASASASTRTEIEEKFFDHMQKFDLKFENGKEFLHRLEIFAKTVKTIEEHNASGQSWTMGLNQFSHMTTDEWRAAVRLQTKLPTLRRNADTPIHGEPTSIVGLPDSVDWVAAGAVTPVKNQGQCGSCWSFSTTGALEGRYFINGNPLTSFSEQELVSCDTTNNGCNGGWMDDAFAWVQNNGGITSEGAYPYVSGEGNVPTCSGTGGSVANSAPSGYTDVASGSVSALMTAVANQPCSIAIDASSANFQNYAGGVYTAACGTSLDHGVLVVGYGTSGGIDYWKVKNSWGPSWGDAGYILIEKSSANSCGVLSAASYPNLS